MFETVSHFRTAGLLDDDSMLSSGLHTQIISEITIAPTCYFNLNSFFIISTRRFGAHHWKRCARRTLALQFQRKKKDNRKLKCQRVENGEGQPFQRIKLLLKENAARARVKNPVRKMFLCVCVSCGYPPKGCDCGGHTASSYKSIRHAIKIAVARHQRTFRQTKNWKKYVSEKKKNNKSNLSTSSNTQLVMPRSIVRRPCCMRSRLSFS